MLVLAVLLVYALAVHGVQEPPPMELLYVLAGHAGECATEKAGCDGAIRNASLKCKGASTRAYARRARRWCRCSLPGRGSR